MEQLLSSKHGAVPKHGNDNKRDISAGLKIEDMGKACDLQSSTKYCIRTLPVSVLAERKQSYKILSILVNKSKEMLRVPSAACSYLLKTNDS
jgi:hypothetical protein